MLNLTKVLMYLSFISFISFTFDQLPQIHINIMKKMYVSVHGL